MFRKLIWAIFVFALVIDIGAVTLYAATDTFSPDAAPQSQVAQLPEDLLADEMGEWVFDNFAILLSPVAKANLASRLESTSFSLLENADPPMKRFQKVQNIGNAKVGAITGQSSTNVNGEVINTAIVHYDDGSMAHETLSDLLTIP